MADLSKTTQIERVKFKKYSGITDSDMAAQLTPAERKAGYTGGPESPGEYKGKERRKKGRRKGDK